MTFENKTNLLFFLLSLGVLLGVYAGHVGFQYVKCKIVSKEMNIESKYALVGGCYLHTEKGWVPYERYRFVE